MNTVIQRYSRTCLFILCINGVSFGEQVKDAKSISSTQATAQTEAGGTAKTITIQAQVEGGEADETKGDEITATGEITIVVNGQKHTLPLGSNAFNLNRTFKKVIKDGEASIAVIGGGIDLDAEAIQKMIQDTAGAIDLPADLPKQAQEQLEKMLDGLPNGDTLREAIKGGLEEIPQVQLKGFSIESLSGLPEDLHKQVEKMMANPFPAAGGKVSPKGKVEVRIFRMVDGEMVPVTENLDEDSTKEMEKKSHADRDYAALSEKLDEIMSKLDALQREVAELKASK